MIIKTYKQNLTFHRFGFLVDYLSDATIVGFLAAAAIGIGLQQLKGLFGINNFTNKADIISVMKAVYTSLTDQVRRSATKENRTVNLTLT